MYTRNVVQSHAATCRNRIPRFLAGVAPPIEGRCHDGRRGGNLFRETAQLHRRRSQEVGERR